MLSVGLATLLMDDNEYMEFLMDYGKLVQKHMANPAREGRKMRKVAFISAPTSEEL